MHRGIGKTGVVGVLRAGSAERSVGLRADMDALPIHEANTFAHRSTHDGRMHACGHDGHTTMLLGAAKYLAETRNFDGVVNFIFQPAEEGIGGARAMIADGLFEKFPCDAVFGMHNRPGLTLGKFAVRAGPMMAGGGVLRHPRHRQGLAWRAARERASIRCWWPRTSSIALQSIVSRNVRPIDAAVVSVTKIHAGDAYNVIPQTAQLSGTVRAFTREVMSLIETGMRRVVEGNRGGVRRHGGGRFPRDLRAHGQRCDAGGFRGGGLCRGSRRGQREPQSFADRGFGGFFVHAGKGPGRLLQHRQRRGRGRLRSAQPRLRFQRRGAGARRERVRSNCREKVSEERLKALQVPGQKRVGHLNVWNDSNQLTCKWFELLNQFEFSRAISRQSMK